MQLLSLLFINFLNRACLTPSSHPSPTILLPLPLSHHPPPTTPLPPSSSHHPSPSHHLTSLLGMVSGVPDFTIPASTTTPTTMGSLVLKMQLGSMRSLQGKTAMLSNSLRFWSMRSYTSNQPPPTDGMELHHHLHTSSIVLHHTCGTGMLFTCTMYTCTM